MASKPPRRPFTYMPVGRDRLISMHLDSLTEMGVDVSPIIPPSPAPPPEAPYKPLSPTIEQWALNQPRLLRYNRGLSGGAHCHDFAGELFALAHQSLIGSDRTDDLFVANLRNLLLPDNVPTCTGGFQDSKQVIAMLAFLMARKMPRILDSLNGTERLRLELIARAALVSAAWVMSDQNPHVLDGSTQVDMQGVELGRNWNPNFTNGELGMLIFGCLWFGREGAQLLLLRHDHEGFKQALQDIGLGEIVKTYSQALSPTDDEVSATLSKPWTFEGQPLDAIPLFGKVIGQTYDKMVSDFRVVKPSGQPHLGELGAIHEFDTVDGLGKRHSAHYANDAWYLTLYLLHAMLGRYGPISDPMLPLMWIGTSDFLFKIGEELGQGYHDFYKGQERGVYVWNEAKRGHHFHQDLFRVLDLAVHP